MRTDIVIVGGGPAGLAAAIAAAKEDATISILILERDHELGGILNQCIHNGFGLHTFNEELTGPEYAERFEQQLSGLNIQYMLDTMVLDVSSGLVTAVNSAKGVFEVECGAVVLCMGCRERPRGALNIPGLRPAGVFTAGTAQRLVNIEGYMPGKEVVILGSGDIGLIMARRMTLEGAKVKAVCELMPYSGGLKRNIVQCLDDFDIPLLLSHTVIDIKGKERVSSVVIAEVDANSKPIPGTEQEITCDTLLLSCGLIPENELSRAADIKIDPATNGPVVNESFETSVPGIFACGNVLHVHDLVDYVSEESARAGKSAARFVKNSLVSDSRCISIRKGNGVRYTVPSTVRVTNLADDLIIRFRSTGVFKDAYVDVLFDGEQKLHRRKQIITPGEMEQVILKSEDLARCPSEITVTITES
ncbi:MAG: FAD-dependent oxidoreductase [Clostridiales bacterium]|nr:FAD-dependent oxidoreductase [Clostridiales bacterium]